MCIFYFYFLLKMRSCEVGGKENIIFFCDTLNHSHHGPTNNSAISRQCTKIILNPAPPHNHNTRPNTPQPQEKPHISHTTKRTATTTRPPLVTSPSSARDLPLGSCNLVSATHVLWPVVLAAAVLTSSRHTIASCCATNISIVALFVRAVMRVDEKKNQKIAISNRG